MPELAEVEYFRRQWDSGFGRRVIRVALHPGKRVFRDTDAAALEKALTGARLLGSEGHGKQMLFRFSRGASLGIHLGMSGRLRVETAGISPGKHDHLVLFQEEFPGVGNWMADEILWQAKLYPAMRAGDLSVHQQHDLWRVSRAICRTALKTIGADWSEPPKNWLIHRRWQKRGRCPRDGTLLDHGTVAGRTTAWCPVCQKPVPQCMNPVNTPGHRRSAH